MGWINSLYGRISSTSIRLVFLVPVQSPVAGCCWYFLYFLHGCNPGNSSNQNPQIVSWEEFGLFPSLYVCRMGLRRKNPQTYIKRVNVTLGLTQVVTCHDDDDEFFTWQVNVIFFPGALVFPPFLSHFHLKHNLRRLEIRHHSNLYVSFG